MASGWGSLIESIWEDARILSLNPGGGTQPYPVGSTIFSRRLNIKKHTCIAFSGVSALSCAFQLKLWVSYDLSRWFMATLRSTVIIYLKKVDIFHDVWNKVH